MHIDRLIVREIELPLRSPFVTTFGVVDTRRLVLVELEDGEGTPGWAECVAGAVPGYTAESVDSAWATITEQLGRAVIGLEVGDLSKLIATISDLFPDQPMARAGVEMACWDLAARREGLPLVELLGGTRTSVPAGIALGMAATHEETAAAAALAVSEGYQRIKLKIQPGTDVALVRAVRRSVGDEVALTVDANGSYGRDDLDQVVALDEFGLQMIEQPLPAGDWEGLADLSRRLETPLCLDESIVAVADLDRMIALRAGDVINLKPGRVGGFTTALTMVERAVSNGIGLWVGGMLETGIGRAHNVALAALEAFNLPGDLSPSDRYWEHDIVDPPWTMEAGALPVPRSESGIGVSIDQDRIRSLTIRVQEIRAAN